MAHPLVQVDWTFAEAAPGAKGGLSSGAVHQWLRRGDELLAWAKAERAAGRLGFLELPEGQGVAAQSQAFCDEAPEAHDVVIAGVGGSALTARIVRSLAEAGRGAPRRVWVVDTVCPREVDACWAAVDPAHTWLIGISKSGGTLECRAVFHLFEERMRAVLGKGLSRHVAVVAGEEDNSLRRHASQQQYLCLPIPTAVGGRFSALSAVGLLPAAAVGLDPRELLEGAGRERQRVLERRGVENPALVLAALLCLTHDLQPCPVLWTYGEALAPLGPWWVQLVAESLGQRRKDHGVGLTPLHARGPADQHSLLQLLIDGPARHSAWFVRERDAPRGASVPASAGAPGAGRRLDEILAAEREATALAIAAAGRPVVDLSLARFDPSCVGAFLLLWEMAVAFAGQALGIDPFGQPAVEWGKRATSVQLGQGTAADAEVRASMESLRARERRVI